MERTQALERSVLKSSSAKGPQQAVILAAGRGSRLGSAADGLPKCLVPVGGEPLIKRQLDALAEAGVSPVLVVIGYAADLVRESVGRAADFVLNPRYDSTNSLHSFFLAREWIKGPVVILNSDVLFDPRLLEALLKSGEDSLAYDSLSGYAREHMNVSVSRGRVTDLSKSLSEQETSGENVGMICLSRRSLEVVFEEAGKLVDAGRTDAFLAEAIRASLARIELKAVDVAEIPWTEIDTPHDLEQARRQVWPLIAERCKTRSGTWRRQRARRRVVVGIALALMVALAFAAAWLLIPRPATTAWETVTAPGAPEVEVVIDGVEQRWWRVEPTGSVGAEIEGPRTVRIDLRCLVASELRDPIPYVAEVLLDGKRHDWHSFKATPDPRASSKDGVVCDRDKLEVLVPAGRHAVTVRLLAGEPKALLVRFRVMGRPEE